MRVSVVGMGTMGVALAQRLLATGHQVTVWNRSPGRAGPALDAGAVEAGSLGQAAAEAEAVVTMLADDDAVRQVALGGGSGEVDALVQLMAPGSLYIDASTVSPALARELAERFARYLAMPVVGGPEAVRGGEASLFVGGPREVVEAAGPLTSSLSARVVHFGTAPQALAAKLTGNFLLLAGLAVLAEAMEIGRAGGLGDDQLRATFGESPLVAPALRNRFDGVLERSGEGWFSMALGGKDVGLGLDLAAAEGVGLPVGSAVHDLLQRAASGDLAHADVAALGRLYQRAG